MEAKNQLWESEIREGPFCARVGQIYSKKGVCVGVGVCVRGVRVGGGGGDVVSHLLIDW